MLQELGLWIMLLLSFLLPEAQSARVRFFDLYHHRHNGHRSQRVSSGSHLQMVTMPEMKHAQHGGEMVTVPPHHHHHHHHHRQGTPPIAQSNTGGRLQSWAADEFNSHASVLHIPVATSNRGGKLHRHVESGPNMGKKSESFAGMLDTPVSGPNPGGNSQSLASMLDTPVSGPNPGGNSQSLASMLDTPVSGPNPGGNSQILSSMLDTPASGLNPGGNSYSLAGMLDTPVSGLNLDGISQGLVASGRNKGDNGESLVLDTPVSGPNPGRNTQSFASMLNTPASGPHPGGNSQGLLVSGSRLSGNTQSLTGSVPNLGGNMEGLSSMLDTPVSGPNPGGNSETLVSMLDTPVSGPNPGDNVQNLVVSGPNPGGNSDTLVSMLETPVSSPNPGGNAQSLVVSGPNPGGNSQSSLSILDTHVSAGPNPGNDLQILSVHSGPNPGGNSKILAASSGPNPMGNLQVLAASSGTEPCEIAQFEVERQHFATRQTAESNLNIILDSSVSGPNPGGNSQSLAASSGPNPSGNSNILAVSSGPSENSNVVMISKSTRVVVDVGEHEEHPSPQTLAASSGPNTEILDVETLVASSGPNPEGNVQILAASSGPNPGGNSNIVMLSKLAGVVVDVGEHEEHVRPQTPAVSLGPNPGGNKQILDVETLAASSGPNPGGNAQILAVSSGPNPGGNSNIFMVSKESNMDVLKHDKSGKTHLTHSPEGQTLPGELGGSIDHILYTHADIYVEGIPASLAISGPNPGGNSDILMVTGTSVNISSRNESKPVKVEELNSSAQAFTSVQNRAGLLGSNFASPGSNPAGNVNELSAGSTLAHQTPELSVLLETFSEFGSNLATLDRNPGGSARKLGSSGSAQSLKEGSYADVHATHQSSMHHVHANGNDVSKTYTMEESSMNRATILNKLPRAPEPPSGPSPNHNSEITQQSLVVNNLRRETLGIIGCGEEKGDIDVSKEESVPPSRIFHHNEEFLNIMRMGAAITETPTS